MITAIDANIFSAIWKGEPTAEQAVRHLDQARRIGSLVICAPVYAELRAFPKVDAGFIDAFMRKAGVAVEFDLDEPVWQETARTFAGYAERRRLSGGTEGGRLLADFIIGSHALLRADRLFTLDTRRYARDFPKLVLMPNIP
jgi:predicted nucleic acid-binding protein